MKVTVSYLQALLERGWSIRGVRDHIEYRDPSGISGSDLQSPNLSEFPPVVWEWIVNHVPRVAEETE